MPSRQMVSRPNQSQEEIRKQRVLSISRVKAALLREQLDAVKNDCKTLETELARDLVAADYENAGISDLPTKTLLEIFALSLLDRHRHIGKLLLVCKEWNNLVMVCPDLWATCLLTLKWGELDMAQELAYYAACVERSGGMLLTVSIEAEDIMQLFRSKPRGPQINWRDFSHCEKFWHSIKGDNDVIFKRFKALYLDIPRYIMEDRSLVPLFTGCAPKLTCLTPCDAFSDMYWKPLVKDSPIEILSSLHRQILSAGVSSFDKLKVLECFNAKNLQHLSLIPSLEILTLRRDSDNHYTLKKPILLPRVRKLRLKGEWDNGALASFDLPNLFCLTFITDHVFTLTESFKAKPQELHWETRDPYKLLLIGLDFAASIGCTFRDHKTIKVMRVPRPARDLILDTFQSLIVEGKVSMELLGARVLDDNSVVLNFNID